MKLLPDEKVVMESGNGVLVLTTHRVRYDTSRFGRSSLVSMTLDSVSSCGLATKGNPLLLMLVILIAAFGVILEILNFVRGTGSGVPIIILSILLFIIYLFSRTAVIVVSSSGDNITVPAKKMKREDLIEFIDSVESEKISRIRNSAISR